MDPYRCCCFPKPSPEQFSSKFSKENCQRKLPKPSDLKRTICLVIILPCNLQA
ncbi:mCG147464 [Mus musculus]|nr:mCG147464 [Mus musculus]